MKNGLKWYECREINSKEYPRYHLTHSYGDKGYTIMILRWNMEEDIADGWFAMARFETIKECRNYMKNWGW